MNKLLILSVLALGACSGSRGVHGDWSEGAHFGPSSRVEFMARSARGEPGVFPAPSGYSVFSDKQRAAAGASASDGVIRQGTASSRTGEFSTVSFTGQSGGSSAHRANALLAVKEAGGGTAVNIAGQALRVSHVDVGAASYAVFKGRTGALGGGGLNAAMEAALPQITGCSKAAGPFAIGSGGSRTQLVYALTCS